MVISPKQNISTASGLLTDRLHYQSLTVYLYNGVVVPAADGLDVGDETRDDG